MTSVERALSRTSELSPLEEQVFVLAFHTAREDIATGRDTDARCDPLRAEPAAEAGYLEGLAATRPPVQPGRPRTSKRQRREN